MPKIAYKWNKTNIDIIVDSNVKNRDQDIKTFVFFMKSLEIKGISEGIITKLYDNSFDTLYKIINITKDEVMQIEGFKEKSSSNLINALSQIKKKNCKEIMIASNIIGRGLGEKKLNLILEKYPFICSDKQKALRLSVSDIKIVNGMGNITAKQFIDNINKFYEFYEELGMSLEKMSDKKPQKRVVTKINKKLENKHFAFSGFRNKDYEAEIIKNNGFVDTTITKTTDYLIIKNAEKKTEKVKKAEAKGIIILTEAEFIRMTKI